MLSFIKVHKYLVKAHVTPCMLYPMQQGHGTVYVKTEAGAVWRPQ